MALLLVILLIVLIATGSLLSVLKVALGVAVGLIIAILVLSLLGVWWVRRKWRAALAGASGQAPQPGRGSSTVEVLPPRSPSAQPPAGSGPPHVIDVSPVDPDQPPAPD